MDIVELLKKYDPVYEEEKASKIQMLKFISEHDDCFQRSQSAGHFTGSTWIVNCDNSAFLLTLHKKLKVWLQCGGHADGDPDITRVAMREAFEESGLTSLKLVSPEIFDIDAHKIPEWNGVPSHYHFDIRFLVKVDDPRDFIKISGESLDLKWFTEVPLPSTLSLHRMFQKWRHFNF